jgi:hypothetical protein
MSTTYYYGQVNLITRNSEPVELGEASQTLKPIFFDPHSETDGHVHVLPDLYDREYRSTDEFTDELHEKFGDSRITDEIVTGLHLDGNETIYVEDAVNALVVASDNNVLGAAVTYVTDSTRATPDCYTGATYYTSEHIRMRSDLESDRAFFTEIDAQIRAGTTNADIGRFIYDAHIEPVLEGILDKTRQEEIRESIITMLISVGGKIV